MADPAVPPVTLGAPVTVDAPRWAWVQLLGWICAQDYEPGRIPWLDDLVARIEGKVVSR